MKNVAVVSLMLAVISAPAWAAPKAKPPAKPAPVAAPTTERVSYASSGFSPRGKFGIGPSIAIAGGSFGFGANFRYLYEFAEGMHFGAQSNLKIWPTTIFLMEIPITPIFIYEFPTMGAVRPYVGIDLGPDLFLASGTIFGQTASGVGVVFTFNGHFGVSFSEKTSLDIALGVMSSTFVFSPSFIFYF